ncbi:MAG: ABC transporter permease subunit [Pseudomonadota bacterium]
MAAALTIAKRELGTYFKSPIAYIVLCVFLALTGFLFLESLFINADCSMDGFFGNMPILLLFFGPAIAMRLFAEERGSGTIELLLTMPVKDWEVVLGKYLAALGLLAVGLILTVPYAITVGRLGPLDLGPVIGGYIGTILLGGTYLAIGLFASALSKNQIVAFIVGLAVCFVLFLIGQFAGAVSWGHVLQYASPQFHYSSIQRGVVELRNVVYYFSLIAAVLVFTSQVLESRKWR